MFHEYALSAYNILAQSPRRTDPGPTGFGTLWKNILHPLINNLGMYFHGPFIVVTSEMLKGYNSKP